MSHRACSITCTNIGHSEGILYASLGTHPVHAPLLVQLSAGPCTWKRTKRIEHMMPNLLLADMHKGPSNKAPANRHSASSSKSKDWAGEVEALLERSFCCLPQLWGYTPCSCCSSALVRRIDPPRLRAQTLGAAAWQSLLSPAPAAERTTGPAPLLVLQLSLGEERPTFVANLFLHLNRSAIALCPAAERAAGTEQS